MNLSWAIFTEWMIKNNVYDACAQDNRPLEAGIQIKLIQWNSSE